MSERIISPGVYVNENDKSFIQQGAVSLGAAFIGPTAKGPVFTPTVVNGYDDFLKIFGDPDLKSYVPYAVKNYLQYASTATVIRVVDTDGYSSDALQLNLRLSGSYGDITRVAAVLAPSTSSVNLSGNTWVVKNYSTSSMEFIISSSVGSGSYTCSFDSTSNYYITKVFGTTPNATTPLYVYSNFATFHSESLSYVGTTIASSSISITSLDGSTTAGIYLSGSNVYSSPATPWFISQINDKRLFKLHNLTIGKSSIYVSIDNIRFSGEIPGTEYGSFDVIVRNIEDNDVNQLVLESFNNVNLDPDSPNYIAKRIGNKYNAYEADSNGDYRLVTYGEYDLKSKYIRVEMTTNSINPVEFPVGHEAYKVPVLTSVNSFPTMSFRKSLYVNGIFDTETYYYGFKSDVSDNLNVLLPLPNSSNVTSYISGSFKLTDCLVKSGSTTTEVAWTTALATKEFRQFSVALQGGFDGYDPTLPRYMGGDITATNVMGLDCSSATANGTTSYRRAIDILSDKDSFDINLLVTPGLTQELHSSVTSYADLMCKNRGDVFYVFDAAGLNAIPSEAISAVASVDSNYSATYYPWVLISDTENNNKQLWVPPTVIIPGVLAFSDSVSDVWFAPAGLRRGGVEIASDVRRRLTTKNVDDLYSNRVNPIRYFVNLGVVVWGNKTLQTKSSALDRISARRLIIQLKKFINGQTKFLVFSKNTTQTRSQFINIVNPYMETIQQRQGLYRFQIIMDESTNTNDVIDRNEMRGAIYLQPTKDAEMIIIDLNVTPTGATFGS